MEAGMSAGESIGVNPGTAAVTGEMAAHRAKPIVLHNSRLVCWLTMGMGLCSMFIGLCMMMMIFSLLIPVSGITFTRAFAAAEWGIGGLSMCVMCPGLWRWGLGMQHKKIRLDEHGANFTLGTVKEPVDLFLPWNEITRVRRERKSNAWQFTVDGTDGSYAQFSSYTFFRARHAAQVIAERAGLKVEKL
jgi:hypothetical protein